MAIALTISIVLGLVAFVLLRSRRRKQVKQLAECLSRREAATAKLTANAKEQIQKKTNNKGWAAPEGYWFDDSNRLHDAKDIIGDSFVAELCNQLDPKEKKSSGIAAYEVIR